MDEMFDEALDTAVSFAPLKLGKTGTGGREPQNPATFKMLEELREWGVSGESGGWRRPGMVWHSRSSGIMRLETMKSRSKVG